MRHHFASPRRTGVAATTLVSLVLIMAACASPGASPPPPSGASSTPMPTSTPTVAAADRVPLIVDTDMSSDDVLALAYLLGRSGADLRAITVSGTGVGRCPAGAANAAALAAELGTSVPTACGRSEALGDGHVVPDPWRDASDALYGLAMTASGTDTGTPHSAVKLMADVLGSADGPVAILALGPLTNLAELLDSHPDLAGRIDRVVMMGGALRADGNVGTTVSAGSPEWNIWSDPLAAARVFASGLSIVMVPLDATSAVPLTQTVVAELARDHRAGGADLAYELLVRNPFLVGEGQYLWDPLAAVVLGYPGVATLEATHVRIGTAGAELGRTIEDPAGAAVTVARSADARGFAERFYGGLRLSPPRPAPFQPAGALEITFDGSRCLLASPPATAGLYTVSFSDTSGSGGAALIVTLRPGHAWQEVLDFAAAIEQHSENPDFVDLVVVPPPSGGIDPILALPSGTSGIACITADATGRTTSVALSDPFTLGGA